MNKILDIIIPAYNAHKTIVKTLSSIIAQTIVDKCKVTIVNDAGENYKELIECFSKFVEIQITNMSVRFKKKNVFAILSGYKECFI